MTTEFEFFDNAVRGKVFPLHYAIRVDAPEVVEFFLQIIGYNDYYTIVNQQDSLTGDTALHYATYLDSTNSITIIQQLCGSEAKILKNKEGKTPFDYASAATRRALECNMEGVRGSKCPKCCVIL
ncbi:MAG: ankyrin repeat domain-containing protein [Amoebophilaceae bacterium]|nr:ankyrin repeat domain-containing protein [Amoebophilaceae bacterium]